MRETEQYQKLAIEIAKRVGAKLREVTSGADAFQIDFKGSVNLLTEYDLWSEKEIKRSIGAAFPEHTIVGEESVESLCAERGLTMQQLLRGGVCWVVDPIDGTTNFANRMPHYGVSIAVLIDGVPSVGVVYNPPRDELFTAIRDGGAFLNDMPIRVSSKPRLIDAVIATGFPYNRAQVWPELDGRFQAALLSCRDIRRWGAASLDCCYVACGWLDGYFESTISPWDIAAGHVIVTEAGGYGQDLLQPLKTPFELPCKDYACGSGGSFQELLTCLQNEEIVG